MLQGGFTAPLSHPLFPLSLLQHAKTAGIDDDNLNLSASESSRGPNQAGGAQRNPPDLTGRIKDVDEHYDFQTASYLSAETRPRTNCHLGGGTGAGATEPSLGGLQAVAGVALLPITFRLTDKKNTRLENIAKMQKRPQCADREVKQGKNNPAHPV